MSTLTADLELERLLRERTDTESHTGDFNPLEPHNLSFNIAWELNYAMRRDNQCVYDTDIDKPTVSLYDLRHLDGIERSANPQAYFHKSMRTLGLIDARGVLTELGIDIYQRLTQEEYYRLHDGDPW